MVEHSEDDDCRIKVFLQLRPMNQLEISKRSKDCIELHEDPTKITVDAPLQGPFDFSFQHVFDEHATHTEVYKESGLSDVPTKLLSGLDCTILAYGQTGTGKTHLIFGPIARLLQAQSEDENEKTPLGMLPCFVVDLFSTIQRKLPASTECTIKLSMVELYLERWTDLLHPPSEVWVDSDSQLQGASELCCLHPQDVYRALLRGSLQRTQSATHQNQDSSRSHVIFQLRVELIDRITNTVRSSTLRMVDLAGSEQTMTRSIGQVDSPLALEKRLVSASLQGLYNYVRLKLAAQVGSIIKPRIHPSEAYTYVSKLTRLLKSSLDGPSCTKFFLTASPSSYNIGETLKTLKFGAKLQQLSIKSSSSRLERLPIREYPILLKHSEQKIENLMQFVKLLAVECRTVRKTGKIKQSHSVWDIISRIAKTSSEADCDVSSLITSMARKSEDGKEDESRQLNVFQKLQDAEVAKEKAESVARDCQSEVTSLRAEVELLKKEKEHLKDGLQKANDELERLDRAQMEADEKLRTSRFREHEAIVFLRQFRTFYMRLLRSKASQGNGGPDMIVNDVIHQIPGVAGLKDMLDVDRLLTQSGLIESSESGQDTNNPDYVPSLEAAQRSQLEAAQAEEKEQKSFNEDCRRIQTGYATEYCQKIVESPAGRLALQTAKELEESMLDLSSKYMTLQNSLTVEKAMVEALSARQGALGKMKAAQEMNAIKSEMDRRTNDLHAIIWKMNELHLVNKTVHEKIENRESHIVYLEEHLTKLHHKYQQLFIEQQQDYKKLQEENSEMKTRLASTTIKLWQLGEERPKNCLNLIIPASGKPIETQQERRISIGDIANDGIELLGLLDEKVQDVSVSTQTDPEPNVDSVSTQTDPEPIVDSVDADNQTDPEPIIDSVDAENQTDDIVLDIDDAAVQTDPVQILELEEPIVHRPKESSVASVQTDETGIEIDSKVECVEVGVQTFSELYYDVGVQTEACLPIGEPTLPKQRVDDHNEITKLNRNTVESGVQTEQERTTICFEATTQTEDLPNEIMSSTSTSNDSIGSLHEEDLHQRSNRPPKPPPMDRPSRFDNNSNKFEDAAGMSQNSLSSIGSPGAVARQHEKIGSSIKWNIGGSKIHHSDGRLGVSMSFLEVHALKTSDRRATPRVKVEEPSNDPPIAANNSLSKLSVPKNLIKQGSKRSILTTTESNIPEWIAKFKEMGIKTDETEKPEEETSKDGEGAKTTRPIHPCLEKPSIPSNPPSEKPEWMQKLKSPRALEKAKRGDLEENLPIAPWAKHMRRKSVGGMASKSVLPNDTADALSTKEPELIKRMKDIVGKGQGQAQVAEEDVQEDNICEEVNKITPEWMLKFKQIGQKGEEKVI